MDRIDKTPDPFLDNKGRVKEPKRFETISTTIRAEMQRRDRVYTTQSVAQTLTTAVNTALLWGIDSYDEGGLHDVSTNTSRITVPSGGNAGVWLLATQVAWAGPLAPAGYRDVTILQNGGTLIARSVVPPVSIASTQTIMSIVGFVNEPNVGDYFEVFALHTQGADLQVVGTFFSAIQLW